MIESKTKTKNTIAGGLCFVLGVLCILGPRFASPELTDTQLFIEYWDLFLQGMLWGGLGYWIMS